MPLPELLKNNIITRTFHRIYKHFDTVPSNIPIEQYSFYIISNIGYTIGWNVHFWWMVAFLCIGQYTMAGIQVVSILCHVVAIIINRRGNYQPAMMIGMLEVMGHQALAAYLLGWHSGFQYLIPAVAIFPYLKPDGNIVAKSFLVLCGMASFIGIEVLLKDHTAVFHVTAEQVKWFNYSNIVGCFLLISTWGVFISVATRRAQQIIDRKNEKIYKAEMQRELDITTRDAEISHLRNVELKNSNDEILLRNHQIEEEKRRSEDLLLNILPEETARELIKDGRTRIRRYELVTVMFTDFVAFTTVAEQLPPEELVNKIDTFFRAFDEITLRHGVEKIKTIGDAYLCAGGIPVANTTNPIDVVHAAMDIMAYMQTHKSDEGFRLRIGIHTGPLVAGVVGKHKFQYDIWGDTVNVAARMEQSSMANKINVSGATYELIKDRFDCDYRGKINAKNKGELDMYFVNNRKA